MRYFFLKKELQLDKYKEFLSGFASRNKKSETLGMPSLNITVLWLKAFENGLIFISIDSLYIPIEISELIYKFLKKKYKISSDRVIFNATHTHSAPPIERTFDKEFVNEKYIDHITKTIIEIFSKDKIIFEKGIMYSSFMEISNDLTISRRKEGRDIKTFFLNKKILMLPNEENHIDNILKCIYIYGRDNKLKLLIYSFSCHPVFNSSEEISSDFIGAISNLLNKKLEAKSIFLQGFLGDIRPNFTTNRIFDANGVNKIKLLFNQKVFKQFSKQNFDFFTSSIVSDIISMDDTLTAKNIVKTDKIKNLIRQYKLTSDSGKSEKKFNIKYLLIDKILFISIPAEVNSKYKLSLSKEFSKVDIIPLGLSDGIIGYLPFYDEIEEGGYEVNSAVNYGWDTFISIESLKSFYVEILKDIKFLLKEK